MTTLRPAALALTALSALAACKSVPPSNLTPPEVLRFGVSHMGNTVSFVVRADGSATYDEKRGAEEKHMQTAVDPKVLAALTQTLRQNKCCELLSQRDEGVPDEARPKFSVKLEELDCEVQLWDNEVRELEYATTCFDAVEAVGKKLRKTSALSD